MILLHKEIFHINYRGNVVMHITSPQTEGTSPKYQTIDTKLNKVVTDDKVRIIKGVKL